MPSKMRSKSIGGKSARQIIDQTKNRQLHRAIFDPKARGWIGPQKETHSKWAKARGAVMFLGIKNAATRPRIDVASLVKATRNTMSFPRSPDLHDINMQATIKNQTFINGPFETSKNNGAVWQPPNPIGAARERSKHFSFDRPKTSDRVRLSSAVSSHQAQYLKKVLQDKDKELAMMQKLLTKSTEENSRLSKELEGYQGKNYDEIYLENLKLKESISRVSRENVMLRGQLQQDRNPAVQRLKEKDQLYGRLLHQNTL